MENLARAAESGLLDTYGTSDEELVKWFAYARGKLRARIGNLSLHREGLHRATAEELAAVAADQIDNGRVEQSGCRPAETSVAVADAANAEGELGPGQVGEMGGAESLTQVKFMGIDGPIIKKMALGVSLQAFRKQIAEKFPLAAAAMKTLQVFNWDGKDEIQVEDDEAFEALNLKPSCL